MKGISLELVKRSNALYQEIRSRHYVDNNGSVGQQLHYLVMLDGECIGIISGGSAAYAVGCRDDYFGITKQNRNIALNGIVDNTVFRLEKNIHNLGTQILSLWRRTVAHDWKQRYGVDVCGFETFVVESENRKGAMYKADNWDFVGETVGSTKMHLHGVEKQFERVSTGKKLVFCKWVKNGKLPEQYFSTWKDIKQIKGQMSIFDLQLERRGNETDGID